MERFTKSLRSSVKHQDWYVALSSALTLPDVCGRLIDPKKHSGPRYKEWFDQWMAPSYTATLPGIGSHCFLSGGDCYALRCSYLHNGGTDITQQRARNALDDFHFIVPPGNGCSIHCNRINNKLQLQVDIFCLDVADAVDRWALSVKDNHEIQQRMRSLIAIYKYGTGIPL